MWLVARRVRVDKDQGKAGDPGHLGSRTARQGAVGKGSTEFEKIRASMLRSIDICAATFDKYVLLTPGEAEAIGRLMTDMNDTLIMVSEAEWAGAASVDELLELTRVRRAVYARSVKA